MCWLPMTVINACAASLILKGYKDTFSVTQFWMSEKLLGTVQGKREKTEVGQVYQIKRRLMSLCARGWRPPSSTRVRAPALLSLQLACELFGKNSHWEPIQISTFKKVSCKIRSSYCVSGVGFLLLLGKGRLVWFLVCVLIASHLK